jgi:hypothetical protein
MLCVKLDWKTRIKNVIFVTLYAYRIPIGESERLAEITYRHIRGVITKEILGELEKEIKNEKTWSRKKLLALIKKIKSEL